MDLIFIPSLDIWLMGLAVLSLSLFLTNWMIQVGIQDMPVQRSSHAHPTPRSGGVAIATSFAIGIIYMLLKHHLTYISLERVIVLGGSLLVICLVSLKDDMHGLSFMQKLVVQIIISCLIVMIGLSITALPLPHFGAVPLKALGGIISALWIIFFMNVFNFMDGLNGLASGVSLISSLFCAFIGVFFGEQSFFYLSFTLFFATLGFFLFNFPKGKIFMGDVGSQFLGLIWAIMLFIPLQESRAIFPTISVYTIPLLFFAFIYDVSMTVGRRIWMRENFWLAHRTHLFQLLNRLGYTHRQVTCLHLGMACLQGIGALYMQHLPPSYQILVFTPYLFFMVLYHTWIYKKVKKKFLHNRPRRRKKK